jgi:hypothetical protein
MKCPMCSGPAMLLGVLGLLRWFKCRNCGWEFNRKIKRKEKKK